MRSRSAHLPPATYDVWVRGYGLVDGAKVKSAPGRTLTLVASPAPDAAAAAQYYPAIYWYSMLKIPAASEFGPSGAIPAEITQTQWLNGMKSNGCVGCHQLGQRSTRTIPAAFGAFASGAEAWSRRVQSGQSGQMNEKHYLHDLIASDRRFPTVNAYGPLFGSPEYSSDLIPILDPVKNTATTFKAPVRDADMPLSLGPGHAAALDPLMPSAYWGSERLWDTRVDNHNSMFDRRGRLWLAAAVRGPENPAFCRAGSDHPSATLFPTERAARHLAILEPKTMTYTFIDTCFGTHHLQFGYDAHDTLWTSGGGPVVGWFDSKVFDETGDAAKAQGWTALVLDTNGNGRRDAYVEPNQPRDPTKDSRINAGFYAVMPSQVDGSVWGSFRGNTTSGVVRLAPGTTPPATAVAEVFNVPLPGFGVRGADIDAQGVVWVPLASGHLGSFDRRRCTAPLNGPKATGNHCPEGWAFHQYPGPGFEGLGENSAESSYYTWVDQHDTFGLGKDVPMSTGNLNDGLIAFAGGRMVVLRVPYPMSFYAKGFDGRIDDPAAGWKGRGLWAANGDRTPWLIEGGKGSKPLAAHFQLRSSPLDR